MLPIHDFDFVINGNADLAEKLIRTLIANDIAYRPVTLPNGTASITIPKLADGVPPVDLVITKTQQAKPIYTISQVFAVEITPDKEDDITEQHSFNSYPINKIPYLDNTNLEQGNIKNFLKLICHYTHYELFNYAKRGDVIGVALFEEVFMRQLSTFLSLSLGFNLTTLVSNMSFKEFNIETLKRHLQVQLTNRFNEIITERASIQNKNLFTPLYKLMQENYKHRELWVNNIADKLSSYHASQQTKGMRLHANQATTWQSAGGGGGGDGAANTQLVVDTQSTAAELDVPFRC